MAKGRPKLEHEVAEFITLAVSQHPDRAASEILTAIENKFKPKGIPIPKLRTVQQYAKTVRVKMKGEEPWSLATMEENGDIPWEVAPLIMQWSMELSVLVEQGKKVWPWRDKLLGDLSKRGFKVKQPAPQERTLLTYREAKWLWRIHLFVPDLNLYNLCFRADAYICREMVADYFSWDFDTSDLDRGLMTLLYHIKHQEIPAKKGKEKQIKGEEE